MRLSDVFNLPEKTYTPKDNGVQGKILAVGPATQDGQWWNQAVSLQGIDNTKAMIEHSSKYPDSMLNASHVGKDSTWRLKWWMNTGTQQQKLSGYLLGKIAGDSTNSPAPAVPYNVPATQPLQYPNPTTSTIVQGRPIDKKDEMICRQTAGKVAGEVVAAWITKEGISFDISGKLLELSDIMSMWFISGNTQAQEPQAQEPYSQGVCPSCQLLRVDCTCPTEPFVR